MSLWNRGATVEPEEDAPATSRGNGSADNGHGSDAGRPPRTRRKRQSTTASSVPMPERGTTSQRGASSSSVARKPPADGEGIDRQSVDAPSPIVMPASAPSRDVRSSNGSVPPPANEVSPAGPPHSGASGTATASFEPPSEAAAARVLEPPAPIALPAAPTKPKVFDDEATPDPFGAPPVETPEQREQDLEPLPLPLITTEPASRGLEAPSVTDPTWVPAARPHVPFEPPPVTSTTMTSHQVAPVPRAIGRRPRVRKVTRVVRHVDPWSVFKIAIVFNLVLYGVLLTAGVLLWNVAYATGTIDNVERFFESFGWSEFEFNGGAIYHSAWIAGLFAVIGLTGAAVLGATLFNLITDLVGGVRMTVLEEEVIEKTTAPMRRFTVRRAGAAEGPNGDGDPTRRPEPEIHPAVVPLTEHQPAQPDAATR